MTDGQLGKDGLRLRRAINQVTRGEVSDELVEILAELQLTDTQLGTLTLSTREGDASTLLDLAQLILLRSVDPPGSRSLDEAQIAILRLYTEISILSGEPDSADRLRTKDQLAASLNVTPAQRATPRSAVDVLPDDFQLTFLTDDHVPRDALIAHVSSSLQGGRGGGGRVALWGPAGFGKSSLAEAVGELERATGETVLWVDAGPGIDVRTLLAQIAKIGATSPLATDHLLVTDLAAEAAAQIAHADLLIVDNLTDPDAARALTTVVPSAVSLLITTGQREVGGAYDVIDVSALDSAEVSTALRADLPELLEVSELADAIGGWPLLLDLVRRSIRRQLAADLPPAEVAKAHLERLRLAGPIAFDSGVSTSKAIAASLQASLLSLTAAEARAAARLGVVSTGEPLELDLLGVLWEANAYEVQATSLALDNLGILRVDFSRQVAQVHPVIGAALAVLAPDELTAAHQALAACHGSPAPYTSRYLAMQLPLHLVAADRADEAIALMLDQVWARSVAALVGDSRYLAVQSLHVAQSVSDEAGDAPADRVATAWLIARALGSRAALDPILIPLFALAKGAELAEALVAVSGSADSAALSHAHLAQLFLAEGNLDAAERNARLARDAAAGRLELGIPDVLVTTVKRLARASVGWALACKEAIDECILNQPPEYRDLAQAVIASELLCSDPDFAISIARDLIDRVHDAIVASTPLDAVLGSFDREVLLNIIPVATAFDSDIGFVIADQVTFASDAVFPWTAALGGPVAGLLVSSPEIVASDPTLLAQCRGLVEPIEYALGVLVASGNLEAATRLCELHTFGVLAVRLRSHLAKEMIRAGYPPVDVVEQLAIARDAVARIGNTTALLEAGAYFAEPLIAFDSDWAAKVCRQLLEIPRMTEMNSAADSARIRLATCLARSDQHRFVDPALLSDVRTEGRSSSPSAAVIQPAEALHELTDEICGFLLRTTDVLPVTVLRALRRSPQHGYAFWVAAYDRLSREDDSALIDLLIGDPSFGSLWSSARGRVSELLYRVAEVHSVGSSFALANRLVEVAQGGALVGLAVLIAAGGGSDDDIGQIEWQLDSMSHRKLLTDQVAAARSFARGDAFEGVRHVLNAERRRLEGQEARGEYPLRLLPVPPIPEALLRLCSEISVADLLQMEGTEWSDRAGRAVLRVILARVDPSDLGPALELLTAAASTSLEAESLELGLLADVAEVRPDIAAPRLLGYGDPVDEDAFARAACAVLDAEVPESPAIHDFSVSWLRMTRGTDRESAWTVRLAARLLAREEATPSLLTAEQLVSPIVTGPTLAMAATLRPDDPPSERVQCFLDGVAAGARVGPSDFVFTSRLTGEALARMGTATLPEVARRGGFETWPGGFTGLCIAFAELARSDGAALSDGLSLELFTRLQDWTLEPR